MNTKKKLTQFDILTCAQLLHSIKRFENLINDASHNFTEQEKDDMRLDIEGWKSFLRKCNVDI